MLNKNIPVIYQVPLLFSKGMGEYKKGNLAGANESLKKSDALDRNYFNERYLLMKEVEKELALQKKK